MVKYILITFILFVHICCPAGIRLPKLISDGMVLQRDSVIKIWGWADAGEMVRITFQEKIYTAQTSDQGRWEIKLSGLKAGGPYELFLNGENQLVIHDVLVGDVWVCSGQSNMELPMRRVKPKYPEEIAGADNKFIRQFTVPQRYNFKSPQGDVEYGQWKSVSPGTISEFSAVAYFFAKDLYAKYKVPIGLINASLGGSPAEAWLSEEALRQFPVHYEEAQRFRNDSLIIQIEKSDRDRIQTWYLKASGGDAGYQKTHWGKSNIDTGAWPEMRIPGYWADTTLGMVNGVVWFRKEFHLPEKLNGKIAMLHLGAIVDADSVWVNGIFVGNTTYMYPPRWYEIPENVLRAGNNNIAIRVVNERGKGGFVKDKAYEVICGNERIDLSGMWRYNLGITMDQLGYQTFVRWKPLGLYNGMLAPLLPFTIKGVIWYQGESNAGRPQEYRTLFPAMIRNWRKDWGQGDFPFLFVQLANFMKSPASPSESDWALLREAQAMALSEPNTWMTVSIDIGEWNDIHPLNKEDVGKRLALAAQHVAYNENEIVYSGPVYRSMEIKGKKIILTFDHTGSGLIAKNGELRTFAIAGADKKFIWAKASIKGNKVIVYSNEIAKPVAVRYAWADNPEGANLYNKENLPASPFRTDTW